MNNLLPFCVCGVASVLNKTIERYQRSVNEMGIGQKTTSQDNLQHLKEEANYMSEKIELLEASKRRLLGDSLESYTIDELQEVENQLEQSLSKIRWDEMQSTQKEIVEVETELFIGLPQPRTTR
ncbi:AGAMOUS-like 20 [Actinidia rufa]|uniref:AGAMOUS-like 20 n=1 Tax=Actinidia rufa TaxID=165716 RepID=A0A7J0G7Y3_9ERIC|nr:AGAMOUS-like 20 [Actinidia rufa]